ncbi:MAG: type II toxin-antitoxin system YafQ family toxin [Mycoplasmataceae bacterium]|jgi:addiction module RelE/StbE family toxin|nr:type II toxin-antitoxin system YafQ family toxin [Mycoplasmataceae bacterium]
MKKIKETIDFKESLAICRTLYGTFGISELYSIIAILQQGKKLNPRYKDHNINYGSYKDKNYRDCHIVSVNDDFVLIYKPEKFQLILVNAGSHEKLFPKGSHNKCKK